MSERFRNYTPPISPELRAMHEGALAQVWRWQNGFQTSDKPESDLDHDKDLFEIHGRNKILYPNLTAEVDSPDLLHAFYIHDTGEIGGLDLSHSTPDYDIVRPKIKRRERANFRLITRDYIEDVELKAYVRALYKRWEDCSADDKEMNYGHLVDKTQATRFGAVHVFPASKLRTQAERLQQLNHVYGITIGPATNLFRLVGEKAQSELLEFMDKEISIFQENGYRAAEVNPYRRQMQDTLLSQREVATL